MSYDRGHLTLKKEESAKSSLSPEEAGEKATEPKGRGLGLAVGARRNRHKTFTEEGKGGTSSYKKSHFFVAEKAFQSREEKKSEPDQGGRSSSRGRILSPEEGKKKRGCPQNRYISL